MISDLPSITDGFVEDQAWRYQWPKTMKALLTYNCTIMLMSATISPAHVIEFWQAMDFSGSEPFLHEIRTPSTQRLNISYRTHNLHVPSAFTRLNKHEQFIYMLYGARSMIVKLRDALESHERGIVFLTGVEETRLWAHYLGVSFINGELSAKEKAERWAAWLKADRGVICVNKAGFYGLDYPHVRFAAHIDRMPSMLDYAQSSGRLGRDRAQTKSLDITFVPFLSTASPSAPDPALDDFTGKQTIKHMLQSRDCVHMAMGGFLDGVPTTCAELEEKHRTKVAYCGNCIKTLMGSNLRALEKWELMVSGGKTVSIALWILKHADDVWYR